MASYEPLKPELKPPIASFGAIAKPIGDFGLHKSVRIMQLQTIGLQPNISTLAKGHLEALLETGRPIPEAFRSKFVLTA